MAGGEGSAPSNVDGPVANYGPKYEAHVAEMQKQLEEAHRSCAPSHAPSTGCRYTTSHLSFTPAPTGKQVISNNGHMAAPQKQLVKL